MVGVSNLCVCPAVLASFFLDKSAVPQTMIPVLMGPLLSSPTLLRLYMLFDLSLKEVEIKAEIVLSIVHYKIREFLQDHLLKVLYLNPLRLLLPLAVLEVILEEVLQKLERGLEVF